MKFSKYVSLLLALGCAVVFCLTMIAGCGGGGGGNGRGAITGRMSAFLSDWARENPNIASRNFSHSYYNNSFTFSDIVDLFDNLFAEPNTSYHATNVVMGQVIFDGDFAQMDGSYRVVANQDGTITNIDVSGPFTFVRENGVWLFYGNQTNMATRTAGTKATSADSPKALGTPKP